MAINVQADSHTQQTGNVVNDFSLTIATKNGSGSQTSNEVLVRSLFRMGIPVSAKNLFPSNIKGLPTWYTIRASKEGYIARHATTEIVVAMNELTAAEDIASVSAGGVVILPQEWKWTHSRTDVTYYEVPVKATMAQATIPADFRDRIANMVYVGVCAQLFDIPMDIVQQALLDTFSGKQKPTQMNFGVVELAHQWTKENLPKQDPYAFEPLNMTEGKILITGNESAALGSLFGGLTVAAWYPITPSTSVIDGVLDYKHLRNDPETGLSTVAVVQAEDELAAIGMIIGAGWAGARSMTATSGPGISLMAEFAGLAYFAEIPCVIWDVTRTGPSTGLPTRTSQGDLLSLYFLSHGDTHHVVLIPGTVEECFEFGWKSLDLAEQLQAPIFVMSDLDLGMNIWMSDPFKYPDTPINHGKTLNQIDLEEFFTKYGEWYRYKDYDGDGVPYRTVPGIDHPKSAYFTRGTGHNEQATYSERGVDWMNNLTRIHLKYETARKIVPQPVVDMDPSRKIGIVSYGSNESAIVEGRDMLAAHGIETNYMRVRALPLAAEVREFVLSHDYTYVIDNNFDGQMAQLMRMEIQEDTRHMISLPCGDTMPLSAQWVFDKIAGHQHKDEVNS